MGGESRDTLLLLPSSDIYAHRVRMIPSIALHGVLISYFLSFRWLYLHIYVLVSRRGSSTHAPPAPRPPPPAPKTREEGFLLLLVPPACSRGKSSPPCPPHRSHTHTLRPTHTQIIYTHTLRPTHTQIIYTHTHTLTL